MRPPPRKFDTDYECLDFLLGINPDYVEFPPDFDQYEANQAAKTLCEMLKDSFGPEVTSFWGYQDATCYAKFDIPPDVSITLSNFEGLAAVKEAERGPQSKLPAILAALEECGYTYVPYHILDTTDANLASQLFDFI